LEAALSFVRCVLGDVPATELGPCGAHEHVFIRRSFPTYLSAEFLLDDVELISREIGEFHAAGGRALVDSMPCDAGRDAAALAEISRRSGVHIVVPTGLHLASYYPPGHWGELLSAEELAELFAADIEQGVDRLDYSGPVVERTSHRAGVIKVATGKDGLGRREQRIFTAACMARRRTGAPILTHTEAGAAALEQVAFFREQGVELSHVVISHADRVPDPDFHRKILESGVCVEYDSAIRSAGRAENPTADLIARLLPEFPDQIMVGMDAAKRKYWKVFGGSPGMQFLVKELVEMLRVRGVSEDLIRRLLVSTPARAYSFS
jgi:phosphotriesterase-related protein